MRGLDAGRDNYGFGNAHECFEQIYFFQTQQDLLIRFSVFIRHHYPPAPQPSLSS